MLGEIEILELKKYGNELPRLSHLPRISTSAGSELNFGGKGGRLLRKYVRVFRNRV